MSDKGIVVKITSSKIFLESYRDQPCGLCGKNQGCGNSLWGKLLNHKSDLIAVDNNIEVKQGDIVNIHYDERKLLKISLMIYFVPLLSLLFFLSLAQYYLNGVGYSLLGAIFGIIFGILISRKFTKSSGLDLNLTISK
jgi:sigma-E factor negative regulatory protein RseC